MARRELTEAEKEAKRIEREGLLNARKPSTRKSNPIQNNSTMEENTDNQTPNNTDNTSANNVNNNNSNNEGANTNTPDPNANVNPSPNPTENSTTSENADVSKMQPQKSWRPFGGDKIERDYSTPKIDQNLLNTPIPEVNITSQAPTTETSNDILNKPITDTNVQGPGNAIAKPEPIKPIVDGWNTLSPDEQKNAAAQTTDMILGVYDKLHYFGRMAIKVDDEEVIEAHNDDLIDMHAATVENDDDPEKEVSIQDFWKDFNNQVEERFVVSDQFKAAVRPPMERLCMKYGLGASDGIFLAFKFGEDAATKIAMVVGFKKTVNNMRDHFEKRHAKFKSEVDKEVRKQMAAQEAAQKAMDNLNKKEEPAKTETTKTDNPETTNTADNKDKA